ncbi:AAA domain-containing protein [Gemmatimonadota bacterium]
MNGQRDKGLALLHFLKGSVALRRKRISSYDASDRLVWIADVPEGRSECRTPFLSDQPEDFGDIWLEVQKRRMPKRPAVPSLIVDWVQDEDLDLPEEVPELRPEIEVLVEREIPDPNAGAGSSRTVSQQVPERRRLEDHPQVEDAWLEYLVDQWEPWAAEAVGWQEVQEVYEDVDFIRRRLEESEERFEVLVAVGLLQWRDPGGTSVKRHLLVAPAEIRLDASRGVLSVVPAASFEGFRIELDMLELHDQPRLDMTSLDVQLSELDFQAWDVPRVAGILREVGNRFRADAQVEEGETRPAQQTDETPRLLYAPAIVLRARRPTAYEELITRLLNTGEEAPEQTTGPWERLISEGLPPTRSGAEEYPGDSPFVDAANAPDRILFPLPTNEEQRQIVHRLEASPAVLVKGPPGTGKSHTIANLICHLLASGERILVTAQAPKALTVLRGLLPDEIRDLCVTAFGSSRDDQRLLEESVRGVLQRQNDWLGPERAEEEIQDATKLLKELEGSLAVVERRLREHREAETHTHQLPGGYHGTAGQIAQVLEQQREAYGWFPRVEAEGKPFPLQARDLSFLATVHVHLTPEVQTTLSLECGDFDLPDPETFEQQVAALRSLELEAEEAKKAADPDRVRALGTVPQERLIAFETALSKLDGYAARANRVLGALSDRIIGDLLVGASTPWERLGGDSRRLVEACQSPREGIGSSRIEIEQDTSHEELLSQAKVRWSHFASGGRRGLWLLAPGAVRTTRDVEEKCLVDGQRPKTSGQLGKLKDWLELNSLLREFSEMWPERLEAIDDPRRAMERAVKLDSELQHLLSLSKEIEPDLPGSFPMSSRAGLASQDERGRFQAAVKAEILTRNTSARHESLKATAREIRTYQGNAQTHPCLGRLADAAESLDPVAWRTAWRDRKRLREDREHLRRYRSILDSLVGTCPDLGQVLRDCAGEPAWRERLLSLGNAWAWAQACAWVRQVSSIEAYNDLARTHHRLQEKIEAATQTLAARRAWNVFFKRLDAETVATLQAWTKAVDRVGRGTGKYAYRHRRTARKYLTRCVPKMPAWIMPLYKLWDTVDAGPGLFDTVIIDEASQAGFESLALLLLAKRIVVVGDDKQNSPEAVGVLEDDIARLAREHLGEFRFRDEFRPDTSLFDHAERAFGLSINLKEHFRCVPEIIRFSNDLCYRDAPLIPLRQAPPNRVLPLQNILVPQGACEGERQRIRNPAEADAVVEVIRSLLADPACEGKTLGVIAMQGRAQAELIERLLADTIDAQTIQERRLRCGQPATFQGDQRDIIVLSLVVAPNVRYRALTRLPDQRRFNVAMSRARDQVWLVHSVGQHDLSPDCLRRKLLRFFESPDHAAMDQHSEALEKLEKEARRARRRGNQPEPYDSWFEVDVALELLRRRYEVRPQVSFAGKRIDLMVDGIDDARLAVECDGDEWHGPEEYEADMARQRQLERARLTFVRVRESEFYVDRSEATERIVQACEELGIYPLDSLLDEEDAPYEVGREPRADTGEFHPEREKEPADEGTLTERETPSEREGPFSGYTDDLGFPDPREASSANVRAALRRIVESDGPLSRASIYSLYVSGCPDLRKGGKIIWQALNRSLGAMLRAGEIVQEDELGDRSPEGKILRMATSPRVRVRPKGERDLLEIPPSEILRIVDRLFPSGQKSADDPEKTHRAIIDHYAFPRLTRPRKAYLTKVLGLRRE